jgi:predicted HTH transcriptional regulator
LSAEAKVMINLPPELRRLIEQGENERLEFKAALTPPQHLARLLASFANAEGGRILLGVREDGTIAGVQKPQVEQGLSRALDLLDPEPEIALGFDWVTPGAGVAEIEVTPDPRGPITTPV